MDSSPTRPSQTGPKVRDVRNVRKMCSRVPVRTPGPMALSVRVVFIHRARCEDHAPHVLRVPTQGVPQLGASRWCGSWSMALAPAQPRPAPRPRKGTSTPHNHHDNHHRPDIDIDDDDDHPTTCTPGGHRRSERLRAGFCDLRLGQHWVRDRHRHRASPGPALPWPGPRTLDRAGWPCPRRSRGT